MDRTLCLQGPHAVEGTLAALQNTTSVDSAFGLRENLPKRELVATTKRGRRNLRIRAAKPEQVVSLVKNLGVVYRTTKKKACPHDKKAWKEAIRRCRRISLAVKCRNVRQKLVHIDADQPFGAGC